MAKSKATITYISSIEDLSQVTKKTKRIVLAGSGIAPASLEAQGDEKKQGTADTGKYIKQPDIYSKAYLGLALPIGKRLKVRLLKHVAEKLVKQKHVCLSHDLIINWVRKNRKLFSKNVCIVACFNDGNGNVPIQIYNFSGDELVGFKEKRISVNYASSDLRQIINAEKEHYGECQTIGCGTPEMMAEESIQECFYETYGEQPFQEAKPKIPIVLKRNKNTSEIASIVFMLGIAALVLFATDGVQNARFAQEKQSYQTAIQGIESVINKGGASIELLQHKQYYMENISTQTQHEAHLSEILGAVYQVRQELTTTKAVLKTLSYSADGSLSGAEDREYDFVATLQINVGREENVGDSLNAVTGFMGRKLGIKLDSLNRPIVHVKGGINTVVYRIAGRFDEVGK